MHLLLTGLLSLAYPIFSSILFSDRYNLSSHLCPFLQFCYQRGMQSQTFALIFGLIYYYHIRSSCLNGMISLYCNIPEYLSRIIFHYFLWLMFLPFFIYIKTSFSTYFPMYLSAHPVMPPFILPLCQHSAFTHYVSHCLIHFTIQSTLTFSLNLVCLFLPLLHFSYRFVLVLSQLMILFLFFILLSLSHSHFSSPTTSSIWLKNCPCNFCFNTLLRSFP